MSKKQTVLRTGLGTLFIGAGIIQATHREFFTALVPEQIAEHGDRVQGAATVALTGIGASFLIPPLNPIARWAATIMLAGTLPAAIDQLRNPEVTEKLGIPTSVVALRIPAQVLVIIGAWYATRKSR
ncbi:MULTISPECIES: hypothetical protein [Dermabacter]|uniref:hypothetical protein n=1 Tax=Dermabacter TaxID=36739 RepID=UPI0003548C07|nr:MULTISPECIES: hypothetical protein [Dermabacter]MDU4693991.1 hypothetical protein [Dermabacter sp.]EPH14769.1 hypothetical protein HMPREF1484_02081 [Dermabacter sp. HFH0086]MCT1708793.1 hypothetical protein [Dermabacter hominis]MCT1806516.1 hypothetical protein [Dermabacter hominis]OFT21199.1 hypothetical protein HMPREF3176_03180 [Dermabacter sp. HMSC08H10]